MSQIQMIKEVRTRTGLPLSTCKKLVETHQDVEAAVAAAANEIGNANINDKVNAHGGVFVESNDKYVRMIELLCETDFAARSDAFLEAGKALCQTDVSNKNTILAPLREKLGEHVYVDKAWEYTFTDSNETAGVYQHGDNSVAAVVILQSDVRGFGLDLSSNLAMQVVATNPQYNYIHEIPGEELGRMKSSFAAELKGSKKPPEIIEKITTGRLNKWYKEIVLTEQRYVKDDSITIKQLIEDKAPDAIIIASHRIKAGRSEWLAYAINNGLK